MAGLLGGTGPLAERWARFRADDGCPPDLVETAVRRLAAALRERVGRAVGLPDGEHIEFEIAQRRAVERVQLLPRRLPVPGRGQRRHRPPDQPAAAADRARVLPRSPHRALPQGGAAGRRGAASSSRRSSWSTRRSA